VYSPSHSDAQTLTLKAERQSFERQSARMSKITNWSRTGCFIAVPVPYGNIGRQRVKQWPFMKQWTVRLRKQRLQINPPNEKFSLFRRIVLTAAKSPCLLESTTSAAAAWQLGVCLQRLESWEDLAQRLELCQLCLQGARQAWFFVEGTSLYHSVCILCNQHKNWIERCVETSKTYSTFYRHAAGRNRWLSALIQVQRRWNGLGGWHTVCCVNVVPSIHSITTRYWKQFDMFSYFSIVSCSNVNN